MSGSTLDDLRREGGLVDVGANLTQLKPERVHEVLQRAKRVGVDRLVVVGTTVSDSASAMRLANNPSYLEHGVELYFTAGVHPYESKSWDSSSKELLRRCLRDKRCVAVGECGLDYKQLLSPVEVQQWVFNYQLELATEFNLPVFLHERDSRADVLATLERYPGLYFRSVVHCFDSTPAALREYLSLGMRISISGMVGILSKGDQLRNTLKEVRPPLASVMIESDAPFLRPTTLPEVFPGSKGSEPAMLPCIIDMVAECLNEDPADVAAASRDTAVAFFSLNKDFKPVHRTNGVLLRKVDATSVEVSPLNAPRFILPYALAKLSRMLRSAAIDCNLVSHDDLPSVFAVGQKEDRVVLLKPEARLPSHFKVEQPMLRLKNLNPGSQFKEVIKHFDIKLTRTDMIEHRRCGVCNRVSWIEDSPDKAEGYVEDSTRLMFNVLMRCGFCNRVYWRQNDYDTKLDEMFAYLEAPLDGSDEERRRADLVVRMATLQQRSNCIMWNGKAGSCPNGNRCEWRHSNKVANEVHVLVIHNRYGLLLAKGRRSGGPLWEIPSAHVESSDPLTLIVADLIKHELGITMPVEHIYPANDGISGSHLVVGRKRYYCVYLGDSHSMPRSAVGARPPETNEPFWLISARPFCFFDDFAVCARVVKKGTRGDVDGATIIKRFAATDTSRLAKAVRREGPRMLDAESDMMQFAAASLEVDSEMRLVDMMNKLKEKGIKCGKHRALWETKAPLVAMQCAKKQVMSANAARVQSEVLLSWVEDTRSREVPPVAKEVMRVVREGAQELFKEDVISVDLFGSTVTGLACLWACDVDVCLRLHSMPCLGEHHVHGEERDKECAALVALAEHLTTSGRLSTSSTVLSARVPVITGLIEGQKTDITLRYLGVRNTELLCSYFAAYEWLVPVCYIMKNLAAWCGIKGSEIGLFSSYGVVLMTLYFCLRKGLIKNKDPSRDYKYTGDVAVVVEKLLSFYGWEYDYANSAVCIMNPSMTKADANLGSPAMMLLDPLEPGVNLTRTMKDTQLEEVIRRFRLAHSSLASGDLGAHLARGLRLE